MDATAGLSPLARVGGALARSWRIPPECRNQVEALVRSRARSLAHVLLCATLLWIAPDLAVLPLATALPALGVRLAIAAALLAIARHAERLLRFRAVGLLVAVQALGFGLLQWLILPLHEGALRVGYGLFPTCWRRSWRCSRCPGGATCLPRWRPPRSSPCCCGSNTRRRTRTCGTGCGCSG